MPPKSEKCSCNPERIVNHMREFLSDFCNNFSCSCSCDASSIAREDIALCKSLFEAQSTSISQLQSEVILLKTELAKTYRLLENSLDGLIAKRKSSPRRLSSVPQKEFVVGDYSRQSNITVRRKTIQKKTPSSVDDVPTSDDDAMPKLDQIQPTTSGNPTPPLTADVAQHTLKSAQNSASRRKPNNVIIGSGDPSASLFAAPSKSNIHLSKVNVQFGKDVLNFIHSKLPDAQVDCLELEVRSGSYRGFKLTVDSDLTKSLLDPSFWPSRLIVKRFFTPRSATGNFPGAKPGETQN